MSQSSGHLVKRRDFITNTAIASISVLCVTGIMPFSPVAVEAQTSKRSWFKNIYRLLHADAHHGGFKVIYKDFDADVAAQMYGEAGFQLVSFMAQDGPSYYPTKLGVVHPGIKRDFTGELTRALKKRGIKTIVYIAAQDELRYHKEHPEWIYNPDPSKEMVDKDSIGSRAIMCLNSPWVEEVFIPVCKEIIELYDVDGFFPDGVLRPFDYQHCYCKYCRESFAKEVGGNIPTKDDDPNTYEYRKWSNRRIEEYMDKVYQALSAIKPDIALLNNYAWMSRYPITPPDYVMHVCWDTPVPDHGMYALNFSFEARYLATLTDVLPDLTWSCMNVSSHTWDDYELREADAFMEECAIMLAGCGRTYLAYNPYPSGNPAPALMEAFGEVNKRTIELEPFIKGCKPVKDAVGLHSADTIWSKAGFMPSPDWPAAGAYFSVCGAHKALIEGHVQMGVANSEVFLKTINEYKAIILPDQLILNEQECKAIRSFVSNGGALIATCETGIRDRDNNRLNNFSIADVLGVNYLESSGTANSYLRVKTKNRKYEIPAYDIPVAGKYTRVETTTAKTLIELVPPYEGIKTGTPPPAEFPEGPGVTINTYGKGKAIYCAGELFRAYYEQDTPVLRRLALWMLDLIYPSDSRSIYFENTPINVEVFYNHRGNERFIHLVNYSSDKREIGTPMVQDFTIVHGIRIHVNLGAKPRSLETVPEKETIPYEYKNGCISFDAIPLRIHEVYRIII